MDRRAEGLTAHHASTAKKVDWQYCGNPRPPIRQRGAPPVARVIGRVETRLLTYGRVSGWVFGAWGECSLEIHALVHRIATARLEVDDLLAGRQGSQKSRAARLAQYMGYVRRRLSFTAVQQQARLLLGRLGLIGEGGEEAAKRRDWAVRLEKSAARERRAQAVCLSQGRPVLRRGFSTTD